MLKSIRAIVFGYNSEARIEKVLECLSLQKIPDGIEFSILVMTNASNDNTLPKAIEYCNKKSNSCNIQFLHEEREGLVFSREAAIKASSQDILIFVDDDNYLEQNYIYEAIKLFISNKQIGIVCGRNLPMFKKTVPEWYLPFQNVLAIGRQGTEDGDITDKKGFAWGAGMCIRNNYLKLIFSSGFSFTKIIENNRVMAFADDYELSLAMRLAGYKIYYSSNMQLYHEIPETKISLSYLNRINFAQGYSSVILDAQIYQLNTFMVSEHRIKKIWVKEVLYCYKVLLLSFIFKKSLTKNFKKQYYKGRLKHLFIFKKEYYNHFKYIENLKNALSHS